MATVIGGLLVDLQAETAAFRRDMGRATAALNQSAGQMDRRLAGLSRGFRAFGALASGAIAGIVTAFSVREIVQFTTRAVAAGDAVAKTADKLGLATAALQEYRFAAARSGVEQRTLDLALQRFTRRLGEAQQGGGELVKILKQYGIAVREADGSSRAAEAVLGDLAEAIQGAESSQEQLRIAFKAFDSEGAALVNLLRNGRAGLEALRDAARDAGVVVDDHLLRRAEELNDRLGDVDARLQAVSTTLGIQFAAATVTAREGLAGLAADFARLAERNLLGLGLIGPEEVSLGGIRDELGRIEARLETLRGARDKLASRNQPADSPVGRLLADTQRRIAAEEQLAGALTARIAVLERVGVATDDAAEAETRLGVATDSHAEKVAASIEGLRNQQRQLEVLRDAHLADARAVENAEDAIAAMNIALAANVTAGSAAEASITALVVGNRQLEREIAELVATQREAEQAAERAAQQAERDLAAKQALTRSLEDEIALARRALQLQGASVETRQTELALLDQVQRFRAANNALSDEEIEQQRALLGELSALEAQIVRNEAAARSFGASLNEGLELAFGFLDQLLGQLTGLGSQFGQVVNSIAGIGNILTQGQLGAQLPGSFNTPFSGVGQLLFGDQFTSSISQPFGSQGLVGLLGGGASAAAGLAAPVTAFGTAALPAAGALGSVGALGAAGTSFLSGVPAAASTLGSVGGGALGAASGIGSFLGAAGPALGIAGFGLNLVGGLFGGLFGGGPPGDPGSAGGITAAGAIRAQGIHAGSAATAQNFLNNALQRTTQIAQQLGLTLDETNDSFRASVTINEASGQIFVNTEQGTRVFNDTLQATEFLVGALVARLDGLDPRFKALIEGASDLQTALDQITLIGRVEALPQTVNDVAELTENLPPLRQELRRIDAAAEEATLEARRLGLATGELGEQFKLLEAIEANRIARTTFFLRRETDDLVADIEGRFRDLADVNSSQLEDDIRALGQSFTELAEGAVAAGLATEELTRIHEAQAASFSRVFANLNFGVAQGILALTDNFEFQIQAINAEANRVADQIRAAGELAGLSAAAIEARVEDVRSLKVLQIDQVKDAVIAAQLAQGLTRRGILEELQIEGQELRGEALSAELARIAIRFRDLRDTLSALPGTEPAQFALVAEIEALAVADAIARLSDGVDALGEAAARAAERVASFGEDLRQFLDRQQLGDASSLSATGKLAQAQRVFDEQLGLARSSDVAVREAALDRILTDAQNLLAAKQATTSVATVDFALFEGAFRSQLESLARALDLPGFAGGTRSAPGGLALVGEEGPELVRLPQGSAVFPADVTARLSEGGGGGEDLARVVREQGRQIGQLNGQVERLLRALARRAA